MIKRICNSRVPKHIFKYNDPKDLEMLLSEVDTSLPIPVAFVHSMTGAICALEELSDVAGRSHSWTRSTPLICAARRGRVWGRDRH